MMRSAKSASNRSSTRRHSDKIRAGSHHRSSISTPSAVAVRESLANVKEIFTMNLLPPPLLSSGWGWQKNFSYRRIKLQEQSIAGCCSTK